MTAPHFAHVDHRPHADWRLICLTFAGGTAGYFRNWSPLVPPEAELRPVELPGRGTRFADPLEPDMGALIDRLAPAVARLHDRPLAIFGHSMGSAIAFALAQRLQMLGAPPALVAVSGRDAPHRVARHDMHRRPDQDLRAELSRLGGTPAEVLKSEALMAFILPILRNDYRLIETYDPDPTPIDSPILAICGDADLDATPAGLAAWADLTRAGATLHILPGDHFYLNDQAGAILRLIRDHIARATLTTELIR